MYYFFCLCCVCVIVVVDNQNEIDGINIAKTSMQNDTNLQLFWHKKPNPKTVLFLKELKSKPEFFFKGLESLTNNEQFNFSRNLVDVSTLMKSQLKYSSLMKNNWTFNDLTNYVFPIYPTKLLLFSAEWINFISLF